MIIKNCIPRLKNVQQSTLQFSNGHVKAHDIFSPANKQRTIEALSNHHSTSKIEHFVGENFIKTAAVLVPLCYDLQNRPSILYNLRSKTMKSHRSQISFPGGSVDSHDNNVIITALRETEEELGINRSQVEIWTVLPYVPTVTSLMRVAPVLAFIKDPVDPKKLPVNSDEVEFAFTVPIIEHLCNPLNWGMTEITKHCQKYSTPEFRNLKEFMGNSEKRILWGITSLITHVVLQSLVPTAYKRDIHITRGINSTSSST